MRQFNSCKSLMTEFSQQSIPSFWTAKMSDPAPDSASLSEQNSSVLPECPYGISCYRQNPQHFKEYRHPAGHKRSAAAITQDEVEELPSKTSSKSPAKKHKPSSSSGTSTNTASTSSSESVVTDNTDDAGNLCGMYLTTAKGIDSRFNDPAWTCSMKRILLPSMGNLQSSVQFNYMFDIPWIVEQYPEEFRTKPLLIIHGDRAQSASGQELRHDAALFPNITLGMASLPIAYGTHHTKMMLLSYDTGMRVVIHTSNLIPNDWHMKTQGMWISPLFPKTDSTSAPDSETNFRADLVEYLKTYNLPTLNKLANDLSKYDMSSAKVCLVASSPGRHTGALKNHFGHLKLRNLLMKHCTSTEEAWHEWPIIGQFSSVGSLGSTAESWLTGELLETFSSPQTTGPFSPKANLNLIYPTVDNVRFSLEGWRGGGSLPYAEATAQKQPYLIKMLHVWKSEAKGRDHCMPHIKTYTRISPDLTQCSWLLITSANMSKAAWGALEKSASQLMVRSYEMGVLFLPKFHHPSASAFTVRQDLNAPVVDTPTHPYIFLPYDLPLQEYGPTDKHWTSDGAMVGLKDRFGRGRS